MRHLLTLALVLLATPLWANPITITANQVEADRTTGQTWFTGSVTVQQEDITLTCNRLETNVQNTGSNQKVTATGNVVITRPTGEKATGDTAVFTPTNGLMVLTGVVTLTHNGTTLTGNRLEYDTKSGKARLTGQAPVRAVLSNPTSPTQPPAQPPTQP